MISPVNIQATDIAQTEPVIFKNIYVNTYSCMYMIMISDKNQAMSLMENVEGYIGENGREKYHHTVI